MEDQARGRRVRRIALEPPKSDQAEAVARVAKLEAWVAGVRAAAAKG